MTSRANAGCVAVTRDMLSPLFTNELVPCKAVAGRAALVALVRKTLGKERVAVDEIDRSDSDSVLID